jgi:hypothetical protein
MSAVFKEPPVKGSYRFVLLHPLRVHNLPWFENISGESGTSRSVEWKGKRWPMLFVNQHYFKENLVRWGWKDITDEWLESLEPEPLKPKDKGWIEALKMKEKPVAKKRRGRPPKSKAVPKRRGRPPKVKA